MIRRDFDDGKDAEALRTIGELGRALGLKPHVLRYWEEQFPMLNPLKRSGGRRYYRADDVALVQTINRLVNEEGYTLKGARAAIEKGRAGMSATDDDRPEAPREGVRRYLTARDLPDPDEIAEPASFAPLRRSSDHQPDETQQALLAELKDIRAALAEAIGD
ncbi:MerR family transcriptional regulator [Alteriqipengyuania lutimaris]|uniref:MerR family transcriptional regulator n=1 Tax=Alteriqipengyuania lutimaris TaxID=1538146 RepID=A0A395LGP2_9SPHN|nr:MerR family transcriptional regulator [Alteriqipengyuania lutimaris]MBB3035491.1 DNA-binding transcriptional MerR regulator [Alteriqipengyuania lutimaris]RDS76056.1 MerR family transcriptional regulator [Alteriqipengyuania lutimaris]